MSSVIDTTYVTGLQHRISDLEAQLADQSKRLDYFRDAQKQDHDRIIDLQNERAGQMELVAKAIIDIYREKRYIEFIDITDKLPMLREIIAQNLKKGTK